MEVSCQNDVMLYVRIGISSMTHDFYMSVEPDYIRSSGQYVYTDSDLGFKMEYYPNSHQIKVTTVSGFYNGMCSL